MIPEPTHPFHFVKCRWYWIDLITLATIYNGIGWLVWPLVPAWAYVFYGSISTLSGVLVGALLATYHNGLWRR